MKKLLDSDWLRTVQFFLNTVQKRGNWMHKKVIKQALVNEQRSSQTANQIFFFFSNQARALDGAIMAQCFPDCVIIKITWGYVKRALKTSSESVKFKTSFTQIFSCLCY